MYMILSSYGDLEIPTMFLSYGVTIDFSSPVSPIFSNFCTYGGQLPYLPTTSIQSQFVHPDVRIITRILPRSKRNFSRF